LNKRLQQFLDSIAAGHFTGVVTATSGTFTGTVHATDGDFSGDISASRISVGNAGTATKFFDAAAPTVELQSTAMGFLQYDGDAHAGLIYSEATTFRNGNASSLYTNRIRSGNVVFEALVTARVDNFLTIWWRRLDAAGNILSSTYEAPAHGAGWNFLASVTEPQADASAVSVLGVLPAWVDEGNVFQFGISTRNYNGDYTNQSGDTIINEATFRITARNF